MGLSRFELLTPRLSSVCSNQLSYRPDSFKTGQDVASTTRQVSDRSEVVRLRLAIAARFRATTADFGETRSRKEVIQPQVLLQLPCYDFTPITNHTLGACLLAVSAATSSTASFRDVTGGVYKARERIHRGVLIRDY